MDPVAVVNALMEAFSTGAPRLELFGAGFRVVGPGIGAPLLAFGIPGASGGELAVRGMRLSFDGVTPSDGDHVLVWGTWSGEDHDEATYHVVLEVQDGHVVETRFFEQLESARWFAGL